MQYTRTECVCETIEIPLLFSLVLEIQTAAVTHTNNFRIRGERAAVEGASSNYYRLARICENCVTCTLHSHTIGRHRHTHTQVQYFIHATDSH